MSIILSFLLLVFLSPLLIITSLLIFIGDGLPIFFKQKRVGSNNSTFLIYKFRTMKNNTPEVPTHLIEKNKVNYTFSGSFLRKLSIDELPQLINIITGEMNFIGPRPALYSQVDLLKLRSKAGVHKQKPGVTGWAQVNGRDEISIKKKASLETYYLNNKSLVLDVQILIMTIFKVLKSEGIKD